MSAWLTSVKHREAFGDLSATEIDALPMSEYAKLHPT